MKRSIIFNVCCLSLIILFGTARVKGGTAENPEAGDRIDEIENITDKVFTVSDLYTYSGPHCTGTKTVHMAKGDPNDDIHIAPGGTKSFYLGKCQSSTWSYMWEGKEVEFDETWDIEDLSSGVGAGFNSDFAGLFAFDLGNVSQAGPLPPLGLSQPIIGGAGHIVGGLYDWITFYNVTASGGMIERDPVLGTPLSPVLPDGVMVTPVFNYNVHSFRLAGELSADLNDDGTVNFTDLAVMAEQWLEGI